MPRGLLIVRCLALAAAVGSLIISGRMLLRWTPPGVVYVSTTGSIFGDGRSTATAYKTIQQALDHALPGDRICVLSGIYQERLHCRRGGTAEHPVLLESQLPGTVTITWECPLESALSDRWRDEGDGIISASVLWPIYRIRFGEVQLYREPFGGPEKLRQLILRSDAHSSFCYHEERIWVWLDSNSRDGRTELVTHPRAPEPQEWGEFRSANLTIEAEHVQVRGMNFQMGVGASVLLHQADHVQISDCAFSGANCGVMTLPDSGYERHVRLDHCLYQNYPQYSWRQNWLSWDELYAGYATSSLLTSDWDQVTVSNCLVAHAGDGLRISNSGQRPTAQAVLDHNLIMLGTDDAFEIEGPARNIRVTRNLVFEFHESLGLSPVEQGPVEIFENVFLHRQGGINGAQVKLINRKPGDCGIRNIRIEGNLFIGEWLCWSGGEVESVTVTKNAFVTNYKADPPWPKGLHEIDNVYLERKHPRTAHSDVGAAAELAESTTRGYAASATLPIISSEFPGTVGPAWWKADEHPATRGVLDEIRGILKKAHRP
jgi:hypothetical protein